MMIEDVFQRALEEEAMTNNKEAFVKALAEYLAGSLSVQHSMGLGLSESMNGRKHADIWAAVRAASPLFGYPTVEEAEQQLREWLGIS